MVTETRQGRTETRAERVLARSAVYRLLSQALVYPVEEELAALRGVDLPQARDAAKLLPARLTPLLSALEGSLAGVDALTLQAEHRRVFSHVMSVDCPPCETFYTARHIFQETQDLSDIGGFYKAFGLQMADKARLDHITVELEFMHFLAYKEAYALANHGAGRARLCRAVQRKFMQDHLGRWGGRFARLLANKADGGYFAGVAALLEAFLAAETRFLRARPEDVSESQLWRQTGGEEFSCPVAEGCP